MPNYTSTQSQSLLLGEEGHQKKKVHYIYRVAWLIIMQISYLYSYV